MSTLTRNNPLPAKAGDYRWPESGHTVFAPKTDAHDAFIIRATRIEFPEGVVFLQVNEVLVVAEPPATTDVAMSDRFIEHAARAAALLNESGLYVVVGTAALPSRDQRPGNSGDDATFAVTLLHEHILGSVERRVAAGVEALNAYVFTTSAEEVDDLFRGIAAGATALLKGMAAAGVNPAKPLCKAEDRAFFKQLGIFLEHVNGNFLRVPVPAPVDALARDQLKRRRGG